MTRVEYTNIDKLNVIDNSFFVIEFKKIYIFVNFELSLESQLSTYIGLEVRKTFYQYQQTYVIDKL